MSINLEKLVFEADLYNIDKYINETQSSPDRSVMKKFKEKFQQIEIPLTMYTTEVWKQFFEEWCDNTPSYHADKCRLLKFLKTMDYPDQVLQKLQALERCGGTKYIVSPEKLRSHIMKCRIQTIGDSYNKHRYCDVQSSLEMTVYLLWYGLSIEEIMALKMDDFDWQSNMVLGYSMYDETINRNLKRYYDASGFYYESSTGDDKFKPYNRESRLFICKGNGSYKKAALEKRIMIVYEHTVNYFYDSGRFYIGYMKYQQGKEPSITLRDKGQDAIGFFEFHKDKAFNEWDVCNLRYDWSHYLEYREEDDSDDS